MSDLWIKVKFWFKTTLITVIVVYVLMFIFRNIDKQVEFWWFPFKETLKTSVLYLTAGTFGIGILTVIMVKTTFTTIKQFRLLKAAKAQREAAELQAKAARLQTRGTSNVIAPDPTQL